jgi:hypothetical protein
LPCKSREPFETSKARALPILTWIIVQKAYSTATTTGTGRRTIFHRRRCSENLLLELLDEGKGGLVIAMTGPGLGFRNMLEQDISSIIENEEAAQIIDRITPVVHVVSALIPLS